EHGLGSDVPLKDPNRTVSSFALQIKYGQNTSFESFSCDPSKTKDGIGNIEENPTVHGLQGLPDLEFRHLGSTFKELGKCMVDLGLCLARTCDKVIGGRELEQSILDSCSAKGRLIHYHSTMDNLILKEINRRSRAVTKKVRMVTHNSSSPREPETSGNINFPEWKTAALDEQRKMENLSADNCSKHRCRRTSFSNLWQQWHYDYGIFTILTPPLFISSAPMEDCTLGSRSQPFSSPDGHTYLQLFDATENKILVVKSPPGSFIVQVGEAADILSRGRLQSTLHSVCRPVDFENISRETFVVFLQPAWSKTLSHPRHLLNAKPIQGKLTPEDETSSKSQQLMQEILQKIPPLSSRLREGMTFAEFSRETTKQYYGGSGTQSRDK
ncbi:uncharacterized protein A4U43_C03F23530, partial [Asparagus officinalis]